MVKPATSPLVGHMYRQDRRDRVPRWMQDNRILRSGAFSASVPGVPLSRSHQASADSRSSAASDGRRASWPSAQRDSTLMSLPSTSPVRAAVGAMHRPGLAPMSVMRDLDSQSWYFGCLLRARCKWPCGNCAAEQANEFVAHAAPRLRTAASYRLKWTIKGRSRHVRLGTPSPPAHGSFWLCSPFNPRVDLAAKDAEINGFCKKRLGTTFQGLALGLGVPIGGDHNNRDIGTGGFCLGKHSRPVIPGMLMSDRVRMIETPFAPQCVEVRHRGLGKFHCETTRSKIAAELLPKQNFDIRFVINHENEKTCKLAP